MLEARRLPENHLRLKFIFLLKLHFLIKLVAYNILKITWSILSLRNPLLDFRGWGEKKYASSLVELVLSYYAYLSNCCWFVFPGLCYLKSSNQSRVWCIFCGSGSMASTDSSPGFPRTCARHCNRYNICLLRDRQGQRRGL